MPPARVAAEGSDHGIEGKAVSEARPQIPELEPPPEIFADGDLTTTGSLQVAGRPVYGQVEEFVSKGVALRLEHDTA